MTRPLSDDTGHGTAGNARRKVAELLGDRFIEDIRPTQDGWLVRWLDGQTQRWRNVGRVEGVAWAELVERDVR